MESQHRFPQSLENARAFSHISTARLRLHSLSKKGIIVDREREKCLTLITASRFCRKLRHNSISDAVVGVSPTIRVVSFALTALR